MRRIRRLAMVAATALSLFAGGCATITFPRVGMNGKVPVSLDTVAKSRLLISEATVDVASTVVASVPGSGELIGFSAIQSFDLSRVGPGYTPHYVKSIGADDYTETSQDQAQYVFYFPGPYEMDGNTLSCRWGNLEGTIDFHIHIQGFSQLNGVSSAGYINPGFYFPQAATGDLVVTAGEGFAYGYTTGKTFHASKTLRVANFQNATRAATGSIEFMLKSVNDEPITGLKPSDLVVSFNGTPLENEAYKLLETASGSYRIEHVFSQSLSNPGALTYLLYVPSLPASASWTT